MSKYKDDDEDANDEGKGSYEAAGGWRRRKLDHYRLQHKALNNRKREAKLQRAHCGWDGVKNLC